MLQRTFRRSAKLLVMSATIAFGTGCSDDDGGDGASAGGGTGNAGGGNVSGSAGKSTAGSSQGGAGAGAGGGAGTAGSTAGGGSAGTSPAANHCGPSSVSLVAGNMPCFGYDPAENGLEPGLTYVSVDSIPLSEAVVAGQRLGISRNVTKGMPVVDFWGASTQCGPALQLLGSTAKTSVECVDSTPTAAYPYILVVQRDAPGTIFDVRVCADVECP